MKKSKVDLFVYGDFALVAEGDTRVFAYKRVFGMEVALVICNFTAEEVRFGVPDGERGVLSGEVLPGNYIEPQVDGAKVVVHLRPYEAVVFANKG